jgi:outer membrane biosynthesis protein TonB
MADGLDAMTAMRTKNTGSRRALPPPRHQPRATPVPMPEPAPAPTPEPAPAQPAPAPKAQPRPPAPATSPAAATSTTDLAKVSIYLDESTDTYLETVCAAARTARPRVDATRSAVVRLALTRLADQLDPSQVVDELQRNAATHTGPGRKRA